MTARWFTDANARAREQASQNCKITDFRYRRTTSYQRGSLLKQNQHRSEQFFHKTKVGSNIRDSQMHRYGQTRSSTRWETNQVMAQEPTQISTIYAPREKSCFTIQYLAATAAETRFLLILLRLAALREMSVPAIRILEENSMNPSHFHLVPQATLPH
jgi:hypothetical protein